MVLMVSNMEGNLDLCIDKKEHSKEESSQDGIIWFVLYCSYFRYFHGYFSIQYGQIGNRTM